MKSNLDRGVVLGVEQQPTFGVTPVVPWALQEQFSSLQADVPGWQPPQDLQRFHWPALVASLWKRLMAVVREPVRILEVNGQRVVEVLDTARILRHADGTLSARLRERGLDGRLQWEDVPASVVVLSGMPVRFLWLGLIRNAALVEVEQNASRLGIQLGDGGTSSYVHELFEHFRRRLMRHADLREMRRKIASALMLNDDAVRIAQRFVKLPPATPAVLVGDYNLAMHQRAALLALEREMPQLIPLYAALMRHSGFKPGNEPIQAVRQFLLDQGLQPRVWRMICRSGPRLLLPVRELYEGNIGEAVLDYLRVLAGLEFDREPNATLIWAMLSRYGHSAARRSSYLPVIERVQSSFSHVAKVFMRLKAEHQAADRHELEVMLEWLATRDRGPLDKLQRRAGWAWLIENTHEWRALCEAEIYARAATWTVPFESITAGHYELRLIASVADLWAEARAMHHCVDTFAKACASGSIIIASVRERQTLRRVATARIEHRDAGWQCTQVRGFANRDPEPTVMPAISELVKTLADSVRPAPTNPVPFLVTLGEPATGNPATMPRKAHCIGRVAWTWSPMHSRMDEYFLSMDSSRTLWLLWSRYYDDNWGRWETPTVAAYGPRKGTTAMAAASRLLEAIWREERHGFGELDQFHLVTAEGLLCKNDLMAVGREVWLQGSLQD